MRIVYSKPHGRATGAETGAELIDNSYPLGVIPYSGKRRNPWNKGAAVVPGLAPEDPGAVVRKHSIAKARVRVDDRRGHESCWTTDTLGAATS